jgi:hypothetical protein
MFHAGAVALASLEGTGHLPEGRVLSGSDSISIQKRVRLACCGGQECAGDAVPSRACTTSFARFLRQKYGNPPALGRSSEQQQPDQQPGEAEEEEPPTAQEMLASARKMTVSERRKFKRLLLKSTPLRASDLDKLTNLQYLSFVSSAIKARARAPTGTESAANKWRGTRAGTMGEKVLEMAAEAHLYSAGSNNQYIAANQIAIFQLIKAVVVVREDDEQEMLEAVTTFVSEMMALAMPDGAVTNYPLTRAEAKELQEAVRAFFTVDVRMRHGLARVPYEELGVRVLRVCNVL